MNASFDFFPSIPLMYWNLIPKSFLCRYQCKYTALVGQMMRWCSNQTIKWKRKISFITQGWWQGHIATNNEYTSSSSKGNNLWVPSSSTRTAACLIGHTRKMSFFLGWYCTFKMGEGNLYLRVQSPLITSHIATVLSVDALRMLWPLLFQL